MKAVEFGQEFICFSFVIKDGKVKMASLSSLRPFSRLAYLNELYVSTSWLVLNDHEPGTAQRWDALL